MRVISNSEFPRVEKVPKERDLTEHTSTKLKRCKKKCCRRKQLIVMINYDEELHWVECKNCGTKGPPALTTDGAVRNWNQ